MENTPWLIEAIKKTQEYYKLPVKIVLGGSFQLPIEGIVDNCCGPREFLSYIKNAECVVTNSFHGMAFSVIFKKKFISVAHSSRNTRLENLLKIIGKIEKQVHQLNFFISNNEIDSQMCTANIDRLIYHSKMFLLANIKKGIE